MDRGFADRTSVIVPPPGYLKEVEKLCKKHNILFIADEVQCGLGRAGANLAYQRDGLHPDLVVIAKALAGGMIYFDSPSMASLSVPGMYPLSGVMGNKCTMDLLGPYEYASSHMDVETQLTIDQDRINHGSNSNSMLIGFGSSRCACGRGPGRKSKPHGRAAHFDLEDSKPTTRGGLHGCWVILGSDFGHIISQSHTKETGVSGRTERSSDWGGGTRQNSNLPSSHNIRGRDAPRCGYPHQIAERARKCWHVAGRVDPRLWTIRDGSIRCPWSVLCKYW